MVIFNPTSRSTPLDQSENFQNYLFTISHETDDIQYEERISGNSFVYWLEKIIRWIKGSGRCDRLFDRMHEIGTDAIQKGNVSPEQKVKMAENLKLNLEAFKENIIDKHNQRRWYQITGCEEKIQSVEKLISTLQPKITQQPENISPDTIEDQCLAPIKVDSKKVLETPENTLHKLQTEKATKEMQALIDAHQAYQQAASQLTFKEISNFLLKNSDPSNPYINSDHVSETLKEELIQSMTQSSHLKSGLSLCNEILKEIATRSYTKPWTGHKPCIDSINETLKTNENKIAKDLLIRLKGVLEISSNFGGNDLVFLYQVKHSRVEPTFYQNFKQAIELFCTHTRPKMDETRKCFELTEKQYLQKLEKAKTDNPTDALQ